MQTKIIEINTEDSYRVRAFLKTIKNYYYLDLGIKKIIHDGLFIAAQLSSQINEDGHSVHLRILGLFVQIGHYVNENVIS